MFVYKIIEYKYDMVVVGVGGVGLCVMFGLVVKGLQIVCLIKVFLICLYIVVVQGGILVVFGNMGEDDWCYYFFDIIKGLDWLGDQDVIEYMCCEVILVIIELEYYGVLFLCIVEGKIYQCLFGGMIIKYGEGLVVQCICVVVDCIGYVMLYILYQQLLKYDVCFMIEYFVFDLIFDDEGVCRGVLVLDMFDGMLYLFCVQGVVLVIGGYGCVYFSVILVYICIGDGGGLVMCVGIVMQDMEFVQFYLIGIYGVGCLIIEGVRGEGGILCNSSGECFMECYVLYYKDLVLCDVVSCLMIIEICEGRGVGEYKDYILFDLIYFGLGVIDEKLLGIVESVCIFVGVDVYKQLILVILIVYYNMGGILINYYGEVVQKVGDNDNVVVLGLYVIGEVVCVFVYGVNCLGLNLLLDLVVFGCVVVNCCVEIIKLGVVYKLLLVDVCDKVLGLLDKLCYVNGDILILVICDCMQCIMQVDVVVFCISQMLKEGCEKMDKIFDLFQDVKVFDCLLVWNLDLIEIYELNNLLFNVVVMINLVEQCKESCGVYVYEDYLDCDDVNWQKYILVSVDEKGKCSFDYCLVYMYMLIDDVFVVLLKLCVY